VPDFRAYVREHLPPLGVSAEREAEIVFAAIVGFGPALRATRIDASVALRSE
jgi:hypothetical protein